MSASGPFRPFLMLRLRAASSLRSCVFVGIFGRAGLEYFGGLIIYCIITVWVPVHKCPNPSLQFCYNSFGFCSGSRLGRFDVQRIGEGLARLQLRQPDSLMLCLIGLAGTLLFFVPQVHFNLRFHHEAVILFERLICNHVSSCSSSSAPCRHDRCGLRQGRGTADSLAPANR